MVSLPEVHVHTELERSGSDWANLFRRIIERTLALVTKLGAHRYIFQPYDRMKC